MFTSGRKGLCRRVWGCGHDTKAEEDSRRTKSGRLHRDEQHCDKGPRFHKPIGPPRGRVAAWRAWSPQWSKCTSATKKRGEEVPVTRMPQQVPMQGSQGGLLTTGCKRVCHSTCRPAPPLLQLVCLFAVSVLCSVCLPRDVLWGPRVVAAPASPVGRWLGVPLPAASCGKPQPTLGPYLYPSMH